MKIENKEERDGLLIDEVTTHPLFKVLGGCSICLNIWIGFITYPFMSIFLGLSLWYMPIYLLSASFILRKIMKVD